MPDRRALRKDEARFRILRLLERNPNISQRELARAAGLSVGAGHYVLHALIERGLVKLSNFSAAEDKRRYAYILTPKGMAEKTAITGRFLARKLEEYEALSREITELERELGSEGGECNERSRL